MTTPTAAASGLDKRAILEKILDGKLGAIIRTQDKWLAENAMKAAVEGGFRMIEFTLTTPGALDLIADFRAMDETLLVGAGTVMTTDQAREAVNAGAQFIVSPVFDPQVVQAANRLGAVSVPGVHTPTEMHQADQANADVLKLFPPPYDVAEYVKYVLGPLPHLRLYPTAGVTLDNFKSILSAGAAGVAFVSALFVSEDMAARDFGAIERRAKEIMRRYRDDAG